MEVIYLFIYFLVSFYTLGNIFILVGKGFAPCNILHKYEESSKADDHQQQAQQNSTNGSLKTEGIRKIDSPFIQQDQIYSMPVKTVNKTQKISANKPPITAQKPLNKNAMSRSATVATDKTVIIKPIESNRVKLTPERPAPSLPKSGPLQPTRSAPPPPTVPKESLRQDDEGSNSSSAATETGDKYSREKDSEEPMEFYVVQFDFAARSENELKLNEGQLVAVHTKQDLENNSDWWLVENEEGEIGYVPANYLIPYKT